MIDFWTIYGDMSGREGIKFGSSVYEMCDVNARRFIGFSIIGTEH